MNAARQGSGPVSSAVAWTRRERRVISATQRLRVAGSRRVLRGSALLHV